MTESQVHAYEGGWGPRALFEAALGVPATEGNEVTVLRNGDEIFPAMLGAIRGARRSVDLLTFVWWEGDIAYAFAEALAARAAEGARVRVLLDALGSRRMDDSLVSMMVGAGCTVERFRPVGGGTLGEAIHRTHRKVLVCDEAVAFTGGVGIAEEWTGDARGPDEWRDTHFRVRGPAVAGLRGAFLSNWTETGHPLFDAFDEMPDPGRPGGTTVQVIADGDGTGPSSTSIAFDLMLAGAERRIRIATAYFTPTEELLGRIIDAAGRGVEVQVLVPGEHSDKAFVRWAGEAQYQRLLDAGVQVCAFTPSMLHAKVMTADGIVALVGSSNLNTRSTSDDDEVIMAIFDPDIVAELDAHFDDDLTRSEQVDPEDWGRRGILQRVREAAADVVSDVL